MEGTQMNATGFAGRVAMFAAISLVGCDLEGIGGPGEGQDPAALEARYSWVLHRWEQSTARGAPTVELTWNLPSRWSDESFRIYARRGTGGPFELIATVTSCSGQVCRYGDINIAEGRRYEYYVAAFDERAGREVGTSATVEVDVPVRPNVTTPGAPEVASLDNGAYLRWSATGGQRYMILVQPEGSTTYLVGETDGTSFYDDRAENGTRYSYFLAAIDGDGHVSGMSPAGRAIPRPDYHSEIVYSSADDLSRSGFRFVARETEDPIVGGNSSTAQWRLDVAGGALRIQPLGQTRVTGGLFTTQLTCGPGSDVTCEDVRTAPSDAQFNPIGVPVPVGSGNSYVVRVIGADNRVRFGKLRVQGDTRDSQGRQLIVFDWAYQLRPDERSLNLVPAP